MKNNVKWILLLILVILVYSYLHYLMIFVLYIFSIICAVLCSSYFNKLFNMHSFERQSTQFHCLKRLPYKNKLMNDIIISKVWNSILFLPCILFFYLFISITWLTFEEIQPKLAFEQDNMNLILTMGSKLIHFLIRISQTVISMKISDLNSDDGWHFIVSCK